ncbi:glycosyltransferase family 2 protein [Patescibacteria group bacterium]|nr:glycosyltransferase family 2 protein [Patescibacteria group bacterium]MBU1256393.1 glycosyltransferase family 2 protein [Patescibacteria group bacterium]MBU1457167.1 glycosyltransferase family 2 protein [Patescibacteria group bacterium]
MKVKDIAIIIVHFKNVQDTLETLDSLYKADLSKGVKMTPYVVNNDQSKELERKLPIKFPKAIHVYSSENLGFSGGNNLGLQKALKGKHDTFILLNNDVLVDKNFIKTIVSSPITKPDVGIVGGLIYFAKGFEFKGYKQKEKGRVVWYAGGQIDWANVLASHLEVNEVDKGQFNKIQSTDYVTGCLLITKRQVLEEIGLLDNKYFLYLEDVDFNIRVQKEGYQTIFDPSIKIWHKVAQSSGIGSPLNDYFLTRNRLLFGFKYTPLRTKFALIREAIKKLFIGTKAQKTAVKDFVTGNLGKGSWLK